VNGWLVCGCVNVCVRVCVRGACVCVSVCVLQILSYLWYLYLLFVVPNRLNACMAVPVFRGMVACVVVVKLTWCSEQWLLLQW
jgi:hypothetical protein